MKVLRIIIPLTLLLGLVWLINFKTDQSSSGRSQLGNYELTITPENNFDIRNTRTGQITHLDFDQYRAFVIKKESAIDTSSDPSQYPFIAAYIVPEFGLLEIHIANLELSGAQNAVTYVLWSNLDGSNKRVVYYAEGTSTQDQLVIAPNKKYFYATSIWHMSAGFSIVSVDVKPTMDSLQEIDLEKIIGSEKLQDEHIARQLYARSWMHDSVLALGVQYVNDDDAQIVYREETWEIDLETRTANMTSEKDFPGGQQF